MHVYNTKKEVMIQGAKCLEDGSLAAEFHAYKIAIPFFENLIRENQANIKQTTDTLATETEIKENAPKRKLSRIMIH